MIGTVCLFVCLLFVYGKKTLKLATKIPSYKNTLFFTDLYRTLYACKQVYDATHREYSADGNANLPVILQRVRQVVHYFVLCCNNVCFSYTFVAEHSFHNFIIKKCTLHLPQ